jgi:arylsulfatase A-like enzyme
MGEHGWFDKRWMYDQSLRTPLVIRWPGKVKAGSVNAEMVSNLDFAETFLEAAGVEVPADMQGRSFRAMLEGRKPDAWRASLYYHYYEHGFHGVPRHEGVATDRYKLIHYYTSEEWELFDRLKDPDELRSVYGQPDYAAVQKELAGELARLRTELKVPELKVPPANKSARKPAAKKAKATPK